MTCWAWICELWFRLCRNTDEVCCQTQHFNAIQHVPHGPGSSVGIATGYRLDGLGIKSQWGEVFHTCTDWLWGPPSFLYNGYLVFPGVKSGRVVTLTPHPLLGPWSWKSRAIPLLPLWAVQPVHSLSACTRVTFTFTLHYHIVIWH